MIIPEQLLPKWFNESFLGTILKSADGQTSSTNIFNYSVEQLSNNDNQYSSRIYRLTVSYQRAASRKPPINRSMIIKLPSELKTRDDNSYIHNEITLYSQTISEMQLILNQQGDDVLLAPRVHFYLTRPNPIIVFEDLATKGFKAPTSPLNAADTISVTHNIAKWHATSYYMASNHGNVTQYNSGLFNKKYSATLTFMYDNFRYFGEQLADWGPKYGLYAEKFKALEKKFFINGEKIFTANNGGFNVLNHGDLTFKNVMVNADAPLMRLNDRLRTVFVDFQLSVWASPAIDIFYLLYLVGSDVTRQRYRDDLIILYYGEFAGTLKKVGHLGKIPTMLDLQIELLEKGFLEVIIATCLLPFMLVGDEDTSKLNKNEIRKYVYNNDEFKSIIEKQLPFYLYKGFLD